MTSLRYRAIGMAGQLGAGKSSVAKSLAEQLGWAYGSFGDYVRSVADDHGLEHSRKNLQEVGAGIFAQVSPEDFVSIVVERSGWDGSSGVVIEGIRHPPIAEALRGHMHSVPYAMVYLDAPREIRQLRLDKRGTIERPDIGVAESHSTERDVPTLIREQADFIVRATGDLIATVSEVLEVLKRR